MDRKLLSRLMMGLSLIFFILSLFFETFGTGWPGYGALMLGWVEVIGVVDVGPFVAFAWFANPLLLAVWLCVWLEKRMAARLCATCGLGLGLLLLLGHEVLYSEGGNTSVLEYHCGYWLWLVSLLFGFIGAFLILTVSQKLEEKKKKYVGYLPV